VCKNLPFESISPENGWRSSELLILDRCLPTIGIGQRVGGRVTDREDIGGRPQLESVIVQILAVVAIIQVRTLKTEVEKGSV